MLRVDFFFGRGLLLTALIFGYNGGHRWRAVFSAGMVALPALYAAMFYLPQSSWSGHADDWTTLGFWVALTAAVLFAGRREMVSRIIPLIAIAAPLILVCAMAFGFRQNVPARTGLVFKQIEYHYYVTLRPLWRE